MGMFTPTGREDLVPTSDISGRGGSSSTSHQVTERTNRSLSKSDLAKARLLGAGMSELGKMVAPWIVECLIECKTYEQARDAYEQIWRNFSSSSHMGWMPWQQVLFQFGISEGHCGKHAAVRNTFIRGFKSAFPWLNLLNDEILLLLKGDLVVFQQCRTNPGFLQDPALGNLLRKLPDDYDTKLATLAFRIMQDIALGNLRVTD